jgi:hypothetical protein
MTEKETQETEALAIRDFLAGMVVSFAVGYEIELESIFQTMRDLHAKMLQRDGREIISSMSARLATSPKKRGS